MVTRTDWFPTRLADQAAMFTNILGKIAGYTTVLPITTAQRDEILNTRGEDVIQLSGKSSRSG